MADVSRPRSDRGDRLLLRHCTALTRISTRAPALERIEQVLGAEFARLLIGALSHPRAPASAGSCLTI